jgi:hypothetical protein
MATNKKGRKLNNSDEKCTTPLRTTKGPIYRRKKS